MKSLVTAKVISFASLLMIYTPASMAMTEESAGHLSFGTGFFLGCFISTLIYLYLNRHYRNQYEAYFHELKHLKYCDFIAI